jgi:hypothetical protein
MKSILCINCLNYLIYIRDDVTSQSFIALNVLILVYSQKHKSVQMNSMVNLIRLIKLYVFSYYKFSSYDIMLLAVL